MLTMQIRQVRDGLPLNNRMINIADSDQTSDYSEALSCLLFFYFKGLCLSASVRSKGISFLRSLNNCMRDTTMISIFVWESIVKQQINSVLF